MPTIPVDIKPTIVKKATPPNLNLTQVVRNKQSYMNPYDDKGHHEFTLSSNRVAPTLGSPNPKIDSNVDALNISFQKRSELVPDQSIIEVRNIKSHEKKQMLQINSDLDVQVKGNNEKTVNSYVVSEVENPPFVSSNNLNETPQNEKFGDFTQDDTAQKRCSTSQLAKRETPKKFSGSYGQYSQIMK